MQVGGKCFYPKSSLRMVDPTRKIQDADSWFGNTGAEKYDLVKFFKNHCQLYGVQENDVELKLLSLLANVYFDFIKLITVLLSSLICPHNLGGIIHSHTFTFLRQNSICISSVKLALSLLTPPQLILHPSLNHSSVFVFSPLCYPVLAS